MADTPDEVVAGWTQMGSFIGFRCGDCEGKLCKYPWWDRKPGLLFRCQGCGKVHELTQQKLDALEKNNPWRHLGHEGHEGME